MNLGVGKVYFDRLTWWISKVQMLMICYLYFDKAGWSWWWLLAIPAIPVILYAERKWILPQESNYLRKRGGYAGKNDKREE